MSQLRRDHAREFAHRRRRAFPGQRPDDARRRFLDQLARGYRFVRRASERGLPIGIVNLGQTRGDPLADVVVAARAGELLPRLVRRLR